MRHLIFAAPERLTDHFRVAPDTTGWNGCYVKTPHGRTPQRARASFGTINKILEPITPLGSSLAGATGLYMLAFERPAPALYVGIAALARQPEGILRRVRKHGIKAMGSNVGRASSTGGVHHPFLWGSFAATRHAFLKGVTDDLSDVRFVTAQASAGNHKADLQHFEHLICRNVNGILDTLCDKLWPGRCASTVTLLTKATVGLRANQDYSIKLW